MRTIVTIHFHGNDSPGGPEPLLRRAGCGSDVFTVVSNVLWRCRVTVKLDSTDERVSVLLGLLTRHNIHWWEERENQYTEKEYDHARLIVVGREIGDWSVFGGPRHGTHFAMDDACKLCGAGAKQTSPLMIIRDDVPKLKGLRATHTDYDDIIVDERLAEELERLNAKGLSFRPVCAVKKWGGGPQTKLPWKQLCAARSMPPMSRLTMGNYISQPCPCKRSTYSEHAEEPFRLAYTSKDVADIDEVMTTWEWYGYSKFNGDMAEAILPYPFFLLSPRVMRVIRAAEPKVFKFWPIRVVPSDLDP